MLIWIFDFILLYGNEGTRFSFFIPFSWLFDVNFFPFCDYLLNFFLKNQVKFKSEYNAREVTYCRFIRRHKNPRKTVINRNFQWNLIKIEISFPISLHFFLQKCIFFHLEIFLLRTEHKRILSNLVMLFRWRCILNAHSPLQNGWKRSITVEIRVKVWYWCTYDVDFEKWAENWNE